MKFWKINWLLHFFFTVINFWILFFHMDQITIHMYLFIYFIIIVF